MKKVVKICLVVLAVAVYLNIGWALGNWMHYNVYTHEPVTFMQKLMSGAWDIIKHDHNDTGLVGTLIGHSLMWPIILAIIIGSWLIYFIFCGGIAKLLGLG